MKTKKRRFYRAIWLFIIAVLVASHANAQIKVVDQDDNMAVSYASIFDDATGKVLGLTSSTGEIPMKLSAETTISIQHINYQPLTIKVGDIKGDTIRLASRDYQVGEVAVSKEKHDYLRIKFYVRQYSLINGQVAAVDQTICYGYYPYDDHSKRPTCQILSQKKLRNEAALAGQKFALTAFATMSDPLLFAHFDVEPFYETLKDGKRYQQMKDGIKRRTIFVREDKATQHCQLVIDSALVEKPFNVPLFGVSLSHGYGSANFSTHGKTPTLAGLENAIYSMRLTHNKTQSYVNLYCELYVLGVDYADKKDFAELKKQLKEQKKSGTQPSFQCPSAEIPPFNKYVQTAMKGMTEPKDE